MNDRVLARQTVWWPVVLPAVLSVAPLLIGLVLQFDNMPSGGAPVAFAAFAVLVAVALLAYWDQMRRRRWVTTTPNGFTLYGNGTEREYPDSAVVAMSFQSRTNFSNGKASSVSQTLRLWVSDDDGPPRLIHLETKTKLNQSYALEPLFNRLVTRLHNQVRASRSAGRKVLGERWSLEGDGLLLKPKKGPQVEVNLNEVIAAEVVDNQLRVWIQGEDRHVAGIPAESANAYMLQLLIADHVDQRGLKEEAPVGNSLGRIIFERKAKSDNVKLTIVLIVIAILVDIGMWVAAATDNQSRGTMAAFGVGGLLIIGLLAWYLWYIRRWFFRCHSHGVCYQGMGEEKRLRFGDVESFTYSATRHYHNGAYTGTHFSMKFLPAAGAAGEPIDYSGTIRNADSELDGLRDHVAAVIGSRMLRCMANGEAVAWTANMTFEPDGIRYRPSGWVGRKDAEFLPYSGVASWNMADGTFALFTHGAKKAVVTESAGATNFFPGFFALTKMFEPDKAKTE